jgi:hypothetical protein
MIARKGKKDMAAVAEGKIKESLPATTGREDV